MALAGEVKVYGFAFLSPGCPSCEFFLQKLVSKSLLFKYAAKSLVKSFT